MNGAGLEPTILPLSYFEARGVHQFGTCRTIWLAVYTQFHQPPEQENLAVCFPITSQAAWSSLFVVPTGFEPVTLGLRDRCSTS